jgi:hypothetical protein
MPLIDVRPITSLHEFNGQSHWLELLAERKRRRITQSESDLTRRCKRTDDEAGNVIETHEHTGDFKEW